MEKQDRIVRRHDFFNRFSKKVLLASVNWKMGDDKFLLRKNNTFRIYSQVMGFVNSGYYAGKYELINDTLKLKFFKNHKYGDSIYLITTANKEPVLKSNEKTYYVTLNNLR